MDISSAHALAARARAGAGVDSSKLRGSTATRVQEEGVLLVEKYHQPVAYLSSVAVFDELLDGANEYARLRQELPLALRLLAAAVRAGVPSDIALDALLPSPARTGPLDLIQLAELLDSAIEERAAVMLTEARLAQSEEADMSLDDFAAEIGIDIAQVRADVAAGAPLATYDR